MVGSNLHMQLFTVLQLPVAWILISLQSALKTAQLVKLLEQIFLSPSLQVLYFELRLPPNGDPSCVTSTKTLGPNRRQGMGARKSGRGKSQLSTAKDTLEKLKAFHALPGLLLEWRRISSALTKVVFPLQKEKVYCSRVSMYRIFGESSFHTATGRVTMCEPNLQNIPKDFEIQLPGTELYYTSGCCEFWYSVCFHVEINERTYLFFFF